MKKCKWCRQFVVDIDLEEHEENCDLNDGGKSDINCEDVANKYF
jgi:hypothetical protein